MSATFILHWVVLAVISVALHCKTNDRGSEWKSREHSPRDLVTVDNGIIRVGVDTSRGGSITYLSGITTHYVHIKLKPYDAETCQYSYACIIKFMIWLINKLLLIHVRVTSLFLYILRMVTQSI